MRISDWSSDVCSSDLGVGLDQQRVDAFGADAPGVLGDLPWFDRLAPALVDGVGLELGKDGFGGRRGGGEQQDRKSTRLNSVTNAHLVCRLLLEKKKISINGDKVKRR